jgi:hypothetical protein
MFSRLDPTWVVVSDRIGDRVEVDSSYKGKGMLYVGAFDGRIHLYQADKTDWNVDYYAHYKGYSDRDPWSRNEAPEPPEGILHTVIRYSDTDKNGFIDRIEYGTAEYKHEEQTWKPDRVVNILDYANRRNPHPDVQPLFDPRVDTPLTGWKVSTWDGKPIYDWSKTAPFQAYAKLKTLYEKVCAKQWVEARMMYDTACSLGMNRSEAITECADSLTPTREGLTSAKDIRVLRGYSSLTDAAGLYPKYRQGYWLKEKVLSDILDSVGEAGRREVQKLYYTNRIPELCRMLRQTYPPKTN